MEIAAGSVKPEAAKERGFLLSEGNNGRPAAPPPPYLASLTFLSPHLSQISDLSDPACVFCTTEPKWPEVHPVLIVHLNPWQQLSDPDKTDACERKCLGAWEEVNIK
ncbi:unnamed protein product [Pleuronectes platessa]|uniref:Uncharacterized protein n=1 Tax=Pleuronectes platessa TaxID=8262 RepID=A0A9N7VW48_PLEPL|nr:unnamed protein product [Pleuronectes platessa]